ncbi:MAG: molybdenum cofactor guanylyltransferase [bacterium]|nr:molybdenum cofactor guanylyltransferase [bacterium]
MGLVTANQQVSDQASFPSGAILAGGQSARMGKPKAAVRLWDGRTMIEHLLDTLLTVCPRVVVVGADSSLSLQAGARVVRIPDRKGGLGPLSGIEALLASGLDNRYIVAACDQPLLSVMLLRRLVEGDAQRPHFFRAARISSVLPLPAHLPASLLEDVQRILASPDRSLRALMAAVSPQWIEIAVEEEKLLTSVNTPSELAELNRRMRERGHAH